MSQDRRGRNCPRQKGTLSWTRTWGAQSRALILVTNCHTRCKLCQLGLREFPEIQGGIIGNGTHRVGVASYMLLRISFSSIEPLEFWDFASVGIQHRGHFFGISSMSCMNANEEEPFSFMTTTSISEQVKRVDGSRIKYDKRFATIGLLLLVRASFCMGWLLLDTARGRLWEPSSVDWQSVGEISFWVSCRDMRNGMRRDLMLPSGSMPWAYWASWSWGTRESGGGALL